MMLLKITLLLASGIATLAHIDEDEEHDTFALLQATLEEKRVQRVQKPLADAFEADEYDVADPMKCANEKKVATESKVSDDTSAVLAAVPNEPTAALYSAPQENSDDPPGASALRLVLQFMTLLIVLDGIRRGWQSKHEVSIPKATTRILPKENQKDKAATTNAWITMVNAARSGDTCSFEKALIHSPPLKHADAWGCTPLHFAALGGSATVTTELLKRGAEVDALDAGDETPLHIAARAGHTCICELLLSAGAKTDAVSKQGLTPLVVAGHASQEQACRLLADCGAGVGGLTDLELPTLVVTEMVRKMIAA